MSRNAIKTTLAAAFLAAIAPSALAQPGTSAPNALQGFQQNRGQPVQIEAAKLEVRDKDKVATFSGNVKVVQGDTTMHCKVLVVYYEKKDEGQGAQAAAAPRAGGQPMQAAAPGPGGSSQISRLEAKGSVVVTQKDQTATGDSALLWRRPCDTIDGRDGGHERRRDGRDQHRHEGRDGGRRDGSTRGAAESGWQRRSSNDPPRRRGDGSSRRPDRLDPLKPTAR